MQRNEIGNKSEDIVARIERLPQSFWLVQLRLVVGVATFFDAFDALAIAYVLPVLGRQWNLQPAQVGMAISIGFAGQLIGALLAGWWAERHGRLRTMILTVAAYSITSLLLAAAWSFHALLIFRFIQGIGLGGEVPVAAAYISEIAKAKGRGRFILLYELVFPLGLMGAALAGYFIVPLGWRWMFVLGGFGGLAIFYMQSQFPESPRWLAGMGRISEAEAAMKLLEEKIERETGRPLPAPKPAPRSAQAQKTRIGELLSSAYWQRTLVIWIMWFSVYLANYSLVTWLPSIYTSIFKLPLQTALRYSLGTQAVGFLGTLICAVIIDRLGRRAVVGGSMILGGLVMLAAWRSGTGIALNLFLVASAAYLFISAASLAIYAYTPELYPTRMRALGTSTATAWLRIASIIGPNIVAANLASAGLPRVFLIFSLVALAGGIIVSIFSKETRERVLEDVSP